MERENQGLPGRQAGQGLEETMGCWGGSADLKSSQVQHSPQNISDRRQCSRGLNTAGDGNSLPHKLPRLLSSDLRRTRGLLAGNRDFPSCKSHPLVSVLVLE